MNVIDFCNKNGILWQPIRLVFKRNAEGHLDKIPCKWSKNVEPKTNDFKLLDPDVIRKRQEEYLTDSTEWIAIDTNRIRHIDVDWKDDYKPSLADTKVIEDIKNNTPYFQSATKRQGIHCFFDTDYEFTHFNSKTNQMEIHPRPQTIIDDVEILNGQWSYCRRQALVHNAEKPIMFFDKEEMEDWHSKDKPANEKTQANKEIPMKSSKIEKPVYDNDHQNYLVELGLIIAQSFVDKRDDWTKIVWALANDEGYNNYELARWLSARSDKYDEVYFDNIWSETKPRNSIGTYIHYSKISNEKAFMSIKGRYFMKEYDIGESDVILAELFLHLSGENYVFKDNSLYVYHQKRWRGGVGLDTKRMLKNYIQIELRKFLIQHRSELASKSKNIQAMNNNISKQDKFEIDCLENDIKSIQHILEKIGNYNKMTSVAETFINLLSHKNFEDVQFDKNGYLFAFRNKVFDLKHHVFVEPLREDYILTTTGYDYEICNEQDENALNLLLKQIFPNENIRNYYLQVLATGMFGIAVEKFFIANGAGGNGKGVLNELMEDMLGNYGYTAPSDIFCNPLKVGGCPEVANIHNKRMVFAREPDEKSSLNLGTTKELTGGKQINARTLYSSITTCIIIATFILECNKMIKINGTIDDSAGRRIRDILFEATFTTNPKLLQMADKIDNIYPADTFYKSVEFRDKFKHVLFKILTDFIREFSDKNKKNVCEYWNEPKEILDRSEEYLNSCDEIAEWFRSCYEQFDIPEGTSKKEILENNLFVSMSDIYTNFKFSDYFGNLSKAEKRRWNKKNLDKYFSQENRNLRAYYQENLKSGNNNAKSVLVGFRPRDSENDTDYVGHLDD